MKNGKAIASRSSYVTPSQKGKSFLGVGAISGGENEVAMMNEE